MDQGTLLAAVAILVSVLIGGPVIWLIITNNRDLREAQRELSEFKGHVAEHYVPKDLMDSMFQRERDGFHREFNDVKATMTRLFSKLDSVIERFEERARS